MLTEGGLACTAEQSPCLGCSADDGGRMDGPPLGTAPEGPQTSPVSPRAPSLSRTPSLLPDPSSSYLCTQPASHRHPGCPATSLTQLCHTSLHRTPSHGHTYCLSTIHIYLASCVLSGNPLMTWGLPILATLTVGAALSHS